MDNDHRKKELRIKGRYSSRYCKHIGMDSTLSVGKEKFQKTKFCSINLKLLPLKLNFFLFGAGVATFAPYLPLFVQQNGLSATAIGALYFTVPVVAVITKPLFGWLADKYRRKKLIAVAMLVISIVFYLIMSFTPSIPKERNVIMEFECVNYSVEINPFNSTCTLGPEREMHCKIKCTQYRNESTSLYNCENQFKHGVNVTIKKSHNFINSSEIICPTNSTPRSEVVCPCDEWCCSINSEYQTRTFWIFFICFIFVGMAERVLRGVMDSMCLDMLKDRAKDYGKQRLWHNIGHCGAPFLTGFLLDLIKEGTTYNYSVAIYLSTAFMVLNTITTCKLDLRDTAQRKKSKSISRDTLSFFLKLRHFVFAVATCVGGVMFGFDAVYYNLFMQEIGASKLLIGISLAGGVFTRVPVMYNSGNFIKMLGLFNTMALSLVCFAIRFVSLVHIYNPLWVLLPQITLCATIDLVMLSTVAYAKRWAPPGTEATLLQIMGAFFGGLGIGLGYGLGGLGFDYYGSRKTYIIASVISGVSGICTFIFSTYIFYQEKQNRNKRNKSLNRELNGNTKVIATDDMLTTTKE